MSTTPPSSSTELKWAPAPFDKPTADVILQASDDVYFRVRKGILAEASSVFDDLFAHATPAPNASLRCGEEMIDGVPVMTMTETSTVLTFILHLYYPPYEVAHSLGTMDDAFGAMEAVRKYMMPHAQKVVAKHFELFAEKDSIRVYAVACKKRLQDEMKIAARASLYTPLVHKTIPEMADITGADYCNLLEYRQACSVAAAQSMPDTWEREFLWSRTVTRSFFRRNLLECKGTSSSRDVRSKSVPTSFDQYISKALDILATRPHSKVIFDAPLSNLLQSSSKDWFDKAENLADNLVSFQKHFAAAVDQAISAIHLSKFQRISGALTQTT